MADREETLTDKVRQAVNNPIGQRITGAVRDFVTDPLNVAGAARAIRKRKKGRSDAGRSGSRR